VAFPSLLASADRAALMLLGGPVFYAAEFGGDVEVRGIFDAAYVRAQAGQAGVMSAGPAVFLLLADLPSDPEDDVPSVTVEGVKYRVRETQKDGMGGVVLHLHQAT
jgi:hypothetical protein